MCKYSENGMILFSNQMCRFFDLKKGICSCYMERFNVANLECKKVSLELLEHELYLLPPSCAYRRLYEGRGLPAYHPLLTQDAKSVVKAKQTVKSLPVFSEDAESDATMALVDTALKEKLDASEIKRRFSEIRKRFKLKWLETYPISST